MKSERRHELQYNVLDRKLSAIWEWIKKYSNYITVVIIVAALVFLIVRWTGSRAEARHAELRDKLSNALSSQDPETRMTELITLADQQDDRFIAVQADIAIANDYALRIVNGQGKDSDGRIMEHNDKAVEYYQRVINGFSEYPAQVAQAHYGLGQLAENRGRKNPAEFELAAKEYTAVKNVCPPGVLCGDYAEKALQSIANLRQPVRFATTAPAPETRPALTQPATDSTTKPAAPATSTAPAATAPAAGPAK